MKRSFLLYIRLPLSIAGFVLFIIPAATNAQFVSIDPLTPCSANWWARCCKCDSGCVVIDPLPSFGYCRECKLLCSGCRKELGDLNKALSDLKQRNQMLYARDRAHQQNSVERNEKMRDAMVRTYGEESGGWNNPATWNLNGFNSTFGKFTAAAGGLATNFAGGLGAAVLFDVLSTLQSSNSLEYWGNTSSTIIDLLTDQGIVSVYTADVNLNKSAWKLYDALKRGQSMDQAMNLFNKDVKSLNRTEGINKVAGGISTAADIYGFFTAGYDLISDLTDIYDNYKAREASEKERERLQDEIVKNAGLMQCIKETQDSLKTGPLGIKMDQKINPFYATKMLLGYFLTETINNSSIHLAANPVAGDTYFWQIDSIKIKSAISQLKQQDVLLKTMVNNLMEEVIPPVVPWILNKWQELKPSTRFQLLQRFKASLNKLINNYKKVKTLTESINENLTNAIIGYETNYSNSGPDIITSADNTTNKKWELRGNEKIKTEMGRVIMSFPAGVNWSIDIYTAGNKFITNRSSFSKHPPFYDIPPGNYNIKLNHVLVENVSVEKGKEVKLKFGFVSLVTRNPWELYNESKEKFYTSGIKPVKFALPVGSYLLKFEGRDHRITIKEKVTLKFELPVTFSD